MAYEHKEGQGSLFVNEKKNDRQPDFKGRIMIKGVMYEIAGWNRTSKSGMTYMSLEATEIRREPKATEAYPQQTGGGRPLPPLPPFSGNTFEDFLDDGYPF